MRVALGSSNSSYTSLNSKQTQLKKSDTNINPSFTGLANLGEKAIGKTSKTRIGLMERLRTLFSPTTKEFKPLKKPLITGTNPQGEVRLGNEWTAEHGFNAAGEKVVYSAQDLADIAKAQSDMVGASTFGKFNTKIVGEVLKKLTVLPNYMPKMDSHEAIEYAKFQDAMVRGGLWDHPQIDNGWLFSDPTAHIANVAHSFDHDAVRNVLKKLATDGGYHPPSGSHEAVSFAHYQSHMLQTGEWHKPLIDNTLLVGHEHAINLAGVHHDHSSIAEHAAKVLHRFFGG